LPTQLWFTLSKFDDPQSKRGPEGILKYFGDRYLSHTKLRLITNRRVAALLWVDGKVPVLINVYGDEVDATATHIFLLCGYRLMTADEQLLPRDLPRNVDVTDPIEPFRIRGSGLPIEWVAHGDWRSLVGQGKQISLLEKKKVFLPGEPVPGESMEQQR
jgi:hypothetical protein